ncbi:pentapeptide repeat-containing protein [Methylobacterium indicum]|uniref:Pentapeptide repeat-containing protein n=1 Tax=Methylobacterium indicum TaxID=1775910 RepID=A0A8H8WWJ7_9HYPH|nr:pentapeptide repeat-containing protein [Methylobacterium indicum]BCM85695.1 hypothetical protein mvi_41560 [Methylobacterium indicum]
MRRLVPTTALAACLALLGTGPAPAEQDMLLGADMASPAMTRAEMTRADVEALIARAAGRPIDLSDKALSGLDLSGLDLRGANLRTARLNRVNLRGADLSGANLEQAWIIKADLTGAKLVGARMFGITAREANLTGADLSRAVPIGDFRGATMRGATLVGLRGGADLRNQSMGLMRAVFVSVNLSGANLTGADLGRARLDFANLAGADLTDVALTGADLSGADLTGATVAGADFRSVDVGGAKLVDLKGQDRARDWAQRVNADRAVLRRPE